MNHSVSVIIPAFNEATTITNPIKDAIQAKSVAEIIIVDDGSTDETKTVVETFLTQNDPDHKVTFIVHESNQGKSSAIKTALQRVTLPDVFMLDADIKDFHPELIDAVTEAYFHQNADMLVYYKLNEQGVTEKLVDLITGAEMLLCGERIVKTDILRSLAELESLGYALEVRMNQYCIDNQKKVVLFRGPYFYHVIKQKKATYGQLSGLMANIKMTQQIISKSSIGIYLKQKRHFSSLLENAVWYDTNERKSHV